jgi:t-SNARE complex subunit (syntaxin)
VEERHQQLLQIERMLTEVRDLFVQMSIIIDSQQELVDRIEYQAQSATNYIGAVDLGAVRRSKRKYLKVKDIFKI